MVRIGVLVSGSGSNLQAIVEACKAGYIDGQVVVVLSDNGHAYGLARARNAGIEAVHLDPGYFPTRTAYDQGILGFLQRKQVDLVCLAGYMRLLKKPVLEAYPNRVMNIHPSLLPAFKGLKAQEQALVYGVKVAGCSVHFVNEGMDDGPVILQRAVPVMEDDTVETLSARILEQEHQAYPQAVRLFAQGRLQVEGRRVRILPEGAGSTGP